MSRPTRLSTCTAIVLGVGVVGLGAGPAYANTLTYSCTADGVTSTMVMDLDGRADVQGTISNSAGPGETVEFDVDPDVTNASFVQPFAAPGDWDRVSSTLTDVGVVIEDPTGTTVKTLAGVITSSTAKRLTDDHRGELSFPYTTVGDVTVGEHWVEGDYEILAPASFTLTMEGEADGAAAGTVVAECSYTQGPTTLNTFEVEGTSPEPTDPEPTDPEPTDPEPTDPEPTDPEPTDPEPTDPEPTDPEPTDPEPTDPEPTDPQPTHTQGGGSGADDESPAVPSVVQTDGVAATASQTPVAVLGGLATLVAAAGVVLVRLRRRES